MILWLISLRFSSKLCGAVILQTLPYIRMSTGLGRPKTACSHPQSFCLSRCEIGSWEMVFAGAAGLRTILWEQGGISIQSNFEAIMANNRVIFFPRSQLVIAAEGISLSLVKGITFELDRSRWRGMLLSLFLVVEYLREKM